jgi:hypothetical protein
MPPLRPKCFLIALVFAWVAAIYVPSLAIAAAGLSPLAEGRSLAAAIWAVADEVAPAAKIGFALLLGLSLVARRRLLAGPALPADMILGAIAMLAVVAALPQIWSRGFGIGLAGTRFDPVPLAIYLSSGALAGLVFNRVEAGCRGRPA